MATLVVKVKDQVIKEVVLDKDNLSIGRSLENDLELDDTSASRHHVDITRHGNKYRIYDRGSANGTFVNEKRINSRVLADGDEIQIGETVLIFRDTAAAGEPAVQGGRGEPAVREETSPSGMEAGIAGEVIKPIDEIPFDYRINVKDLVARGESWALAPQPAALTKDAQRFFILYQLGKAVTSATSLDEIFNIALSSVFDFIKAERGVIMLLDKNTGNLAPKLTLCRAKGDGTGTPGVTGFMPGEPIYISHTITNKVIHDKVAIITSDALHDPRFQMGVSIAQYNVRSALCVPLWEREEILGVIYVDSLLQTYAFTPEDLDLVAAIANQIAIRIKQEDLYETLRKEALLRSNLERYHSPDVVELIIRKSLDREIGLDVEEKEVTVLFADIQDFTTISERLKPSELATLLNDFFETTTQIVFEHKGSVNKYIGDSIMAIFGAPLNLPEHPRAAVQAGLEIIDGIRKLLEKDPDGPGDKAVKYHVRVGINTGEVVAGNIGARKRIEYTVLGDAVNIASRLNQYGSANEVVIGEATYERVKDCFLTQDLGAVKLKGKEKEVRVYRVLP